jgi:hypothetical protein
MLDLTESPKEKKHESPEPVELTIQQKKIISDIEEAKWKSCCFEIHSQSSVFFAKVGISISVMSLCAYQLITLKDCQYQSLYSSLLSSIITYWLSKGR